MSFCGMTKPIASVPKMNTQRMINTAKNTAFGKDFAGFCMYGTCTACISMPAKNRNIEAASTMVPNLEKSGQKGW